MNEGNFSLTYVIENDFKILKLYRYNILNLWGYAGATEEETSKISTLKK